MQSARGEIREFGVPPQRTLECESAFFEHTG